MFDGIRILYKYDPEEAKKLHKQFIQRGGTPHPTPSTSKKYLSIYNIFGFSIAELASKIANPPKDTIH
jgi:hypothetical protein